MIVVFDAATILLALYPEASPPIDPATGKPLTEAKKRVEHLIDTLSEQNAQIVVPAPALSEVLVRSGSATNAYVEQLTKKPFRLAAFGTLAAVEVAMMMNAAKETGNKRSPVDDDAIWSKVKYDRQIVAIAKVERAMRIYTDDGDMRKHAEAAGIPVTTVSELPLPPAKAEQATLLLEEPK